MKKYRQNQTSFFSFPLLFTGSPYCCWITKFVNLLQKHKVLSIFRFNKGLQAKPSS